MKEECKVTVRKGCTWRPIDIGISPWDIVTLRENASNCRIRIEIIKESRNRGSWVHCPWIWRFDNLSNDLSYKRYRRYLREHGGIIRSNILEQYKRNSTSN